MSNSVHGRRSTRRLATCARGEDCLPPITNEDAGELAASGKDAVSR
jgi:hypothetical protein